MKKVLDFVMEWKTAACFSYTGTVLLYMVIAALMGLDNAPLSILFAFLLLSAGGTLLQYICFTDRYIKKMRYTGRLVLFVAIFLPFLLAIAHWFHWFPMGDGKAWLLFAAIFIAILAVMTGGFEIYFRVTGKKYDGLLGQYRAERERK